MGRGAGSPGRHQLGSVLYRLYRGRLPRGPAGRRGWSVPRKEGGPDGAPARPIGHVPCLVGRGPPTPEARGSCPLQPEPCPLCPGTGVRFPPDYATVLPNAVVKAKLSGRLAAGLDNGSVAIGPRPTPPSRPQIGMPITSRGRGTSLLTHAVP
jgi:hypothetical protein